MTHMQSLDSKLASVNDTLADLKELFLRFERTEKLGRVTSETVTRVVGNLKKIGLDVDGDASTSVFLELKAKMETYASRFAAVEGASLLLQRSVCRRLRLLPSSAVICVRHRGRTPRSVREPGGLPPRRRGEARHGEGGCAHRQEVPGDRVVPAPSHQGRWRRRGACVVSAR